MNIKIFVSHRIDQSNTVINDDMYVPVRCGAVYDYYHFNDQMQGDDTGDNISSKRMSYNELTVLYWAWKNQKADYMGLCAYRRYLCSKGEGEVQFAEHNAGCWNVDYLDDGTVEKYGLAKKDLEEAIKGNDAVFMKKFELSHFGLKSNYEAMSRSSDYHNMADVDCMMDILKKDYPWIYESAKEYMMNYGYSSIYIIFIMSYELFNKFCEFLFGVLKKVEDKIDVSGYDQKKYRVFGTLAERLLGIYSIFLESRNYKVKYLPLIFVKNPNSLSVSESLNDSVVVASNFDNNYVKYFSAFLISCLRYISPSRKYSFVVIIRSITNENRLALMSIIKDYSNVKLYFLDPSYILSTDGINIKDIAVYTTDLYYRVFIPYLLASTDKVLVADADMIAREDIASLFDVNPGENNYICGVQDSVYSGMLREYKDLDKYTINFLNLKNPHTYINTGVLVMDCKKIRRDFSLEYLKQFVDYHVDKVRIYEQDMINKLFAGHIKFIDHKWNIYIETGPHITKFMDEGVFLESNAVRKAYFDGKGIIHYANKPKPWEDDHITQANLAFYECYKDSPFYYFDHFNFKAKNSNNLITNIQNIEAPYNRKVLHDFLKNKIIKYKFLNYLSLFVIAKFRHRLSYYISLKKIL